MIMNFTEEEEKYINFKDWTCVKATTPPEILKSLMEKVACHNKYASSTVYAVNSYLFLAGNLR